MQEMKWSQQDLENCDDFYYHLLIAKMGTDNEIREKEMEKERKKYN